MWIGTHEGLSILKKETYSISYHPDTSLLGKSIFTLLNGHDSTIWVGYNGGVKRYNSDLSLKNDYSFKPNDAHSLPLANVNFIFEDLYKNIWVLLWQKGLYKFNEETGGFIKYPKVGNSDNPFRMFQDDKKNYWVGTWNEGLYHVGERDISKGKYVKIALPEWKEDTHDNRFFSFVQDDYSKYLWAGYLGLNSATHFGVSVPPISV